MYSFIPSARRALVALGSLSCVAVAPLAPAASLGPGDIRMVTGGLTNVYETVADDINNDGIVLGAGDFLGVSGTRPFLDPGFSGLTVDPLPPIDGHINFVGAIAKNGNAVAGFRYTTPGGPFGGWFRQGAPGSSVNNLGTLGGPATAVGGVNASGVIVGGSDTATSGVDHAFRHPGIPNGTLVDLGTLTGAGKSAARDINDAGVIVGGSTGANGRVEPYILPPGGVMRSLGKFPGLPNADVEASAINEPGMVVGTAVFHNRISDPLMNFAFRHNGGVNDSMQVLPTLGGNLTRAEDVNDDGYIVGLAQPNDSFFAHAVLWRPNNSLVDLNDYLVQTNPLEAAKWTLSQALGINNSRMVVGVGTFNDGPDGLSDGVRGFVLDASGIVPEPAGLALIGASTFATSCRGRRRQRH